jgi:hypothetical protein
MANVFVYDNTRRIASLKGDTFELAGTLGYTVPMGRVALFMEAGYHTRYLGGVFYDDYERPMDIAGLPRSLYFGGFTLAIGFQLDLTSKKPEAPKCKFEIPQACGAGAPAPERGARR